MHPHRHRTTLTLTALLASLAAGLLPATTAHAADTGVTVDFSTAGGAPVTTPPAPSTG